MLFINLLLKILVMGVAAVASAPSATDCRQANTTLEMTECYAEKINQAEQQLQIYLAAALERYAEDIEVTQWIEIAQQHWQTYRESHCTSQYQIWRTGSIRSIIAATCHLEMIEQRTRLIWQDYLTYLDSSPPILPEPVSWTTP